MGIPQASFGSVRIISFVNFCEVHVTDFGEPFFSEEREELPQFEAKLSDDESAKLAKKFESSKKMLPTRYVIPPP